MVLNIIKYSKWSETLFAGFKPDWRNYVFWHFEINEENENFALIIFEKIALIIFYLNNENYF